MQTRVCTVDCGALAAAANSRGTWSVLRWRRARICRRPAAKGTDVLRQIHVGPGQLPGGRSNVCGVHGPRALSRLVAAAGFAVGYKAPPPVMGAHLFEPRACWYRTVDCAYSHVQRKARPFSLGSAKARRKRVIVLCMLIAVHAHAQPNRATQQTCSLSDRCSPLMGGFELKAVPSAPRRHRRSERGLGIGRWRLGGGGRL